MYWWFWDAYLSRSAAWAVEDADAGDADELSELHRAAFARGWTVDEMDALLNDRAVVGCVLRREGRERAYGFALSRVAEAEADLSRDYYRVETEAGERFWLFRDGPMEAQGRWWLHGLGEA